MTYQEAAIIIGNISINWVDECYTVCEYQEAKRIAIEVLMERGLKTKEFRDKPQKVLYRKQSYGTPWLCPVCEADQSEVQFIDTGGATIGGKYSFCWACGQKLDWDVEEYKEEALKERDESSAC